MRGAALLSSILLIACSSGTPKGESEPGPLSRDSQVGPEGVAASEEPVAPVSAEQPAVAPKERVVRDLIGEAARAELSAGGPLIDMGTLDQHKYSRGGWLSGWGRNELEGEHTVSSIDGSRAWLELATDRPVKEIVVRARHPRGRGSLGLAIDKGAQLKKPVSNEVEEIRFSLKKALAPGRHRISLSGRGIDVDAVWLAEKSGEAMPPQLSTEGGESVSAEQAASLSYYLELPEGAILRGTLESQAASRLLIQRDGTSDELRVDLEAGELEVDLSAYAGQPLRLTLESDGPATWKRARIAQAKRVAPLPSAKAPKNLIVLLIDTARADVFAPIAGDEAIGATAYDGLAAKSTVFPNAYNNENWTKPSIATIDTGMYPTSHGARWRKDRCSSDLVFLSEHLKEQGFATAAYVSNISAGPKFGFDQGWDSFTKTEDAEHAFSKADEWLEGRDPNKRFFLYVQTIDPHVPFVVPQGSTAPYYPGEYKGKLGPSFEQSEEDALNDGSLTLNDDDARWLRALYNAEVMHHDKYLGIFLERLAERGLLEDTAFVILNDHGEEFGEQGRWGHGWTMGDALYRSPLLMHMPGVFPVKRVEEVVEHVDVAPTLADLLGVPALETAQGQSLMPLIRGEEVVERQPFSALLFGRPKKRAIRVGQYKLILEGTHKASLFDVLADPDQQQDLLEQRPIARRLLEHALGEALANPNKAQRRADRSELPTIRAEYIKE